MKDFFQKFSDDMIHQTQGENFIEYWWVLILMVFSYAAVVIALDLGGLNEKDDDE